MSKIILASQSPRRKQLLEQAEVDFTVFTAHANEDFPDTLSLEDVPVFIARNKAAAVRESLSDEPDSLVIAADTVVLLEGSIIGKPKDEADAIAMLRALSGKVHLVITGVVLQTAAETVVLKEITSVHFRKLSDRQILHYVQHYQPFDKAGAYAIQEWIGLVGIEKIEGDFYNVMGLPISKVLPVLEKMDRIPQ